MKSKKRNALTAIIILGLAVIGAWFYFKPSYPPVYSSLISTLKQNGFKVKDVTKDFAKNYPSELPHNQKILDVDGKQVFVLIEDGKTINAAVQKQLSNYLNPLISYKGIPHLYNKDDLMVTYMGNDVELLKALEGVLGKSLIN